MQVIPPGDSRPHVAPGGGGGAHILRIGPLPPVRRLIAQCFASCTAGSTQSEYTQVHARRVSPLALRAISLYSQPMPSCVTPYDRVLASNSGCSSVVLSKPYPHPLRCATHACRFAHFHSSKFHMTDTNQPAEDPQDCAPLHRPTALCAAPRFPMYGLALRCAVLVPALMHVMYVCAPLHAR